jgi:hypothetical protein
MTTGWPTRLLALCAACAACQTFATVAIVDVPDVGPGQTSGESADGSRGEDALSRDGGAGSVLSLDGALPCGDAACNLSFEVCCVCPGCLVPFPNTCFPSFPGCVPATVYSPLACGSSANCPDDIPCCASFSDAGLTGASCRSACSNTDVRLCASDDECAPEQTCSPLASIPGFTGCQ